MSPLVIATILGCIAVAVGLTWVFYRTDED